MKTYTIPTVSREIIEKAITRFQKKAVVYGGELVVSYGEPYAAERTVYEYDFDERGMFRRELGTQLIEVFDVSIDCDIIRKGGYSIVAKIEHLEGGNVVSTMGEAHKAEWSEMKPRCQHCGGNHGQKVTFIVRHENGSELQVGRTCLKDYCGIDPKHILMVNQLTDLLLSEDTEHHDFGKFPVPRAYSTVEILALAAKVVKAQGYVKSSDRGSNCEAIAELVRKGIHPTEAETAAAEQMAQAINVLDADTARWNLLDNVQTLIRSGYCTGKHFGYMAYAPVAYKRYQDKLEEQKQREAVKEAQRSSSEHIGKIGQRMVIELAEMELLTSWETQYGYTYLYKFVDNAGNVLVWFASKTMNTATRIKATVKDHTERDGVKQTVITRCVAA